MDFWGLMAPELRRYQSPCLDAAPVTSRLTQKRAARDVPDLTATIRVKAGPAQLILRNIVAIAC